MKSGASDPFADDATVDEGDERNLNESGSPPADEPDGTGASPSGADGTTAAESSTDDGDTTDDGNTTNDDSMNADDPTNDGDDTASSSSSSSNDQSDTGTGHTISKADLPLLLRRDTVKAERENVHQLFVQDETDTRARQAENELSERLDTDVYRLDAREAIYLAGMKNLADAEEILEEWGYNF